MPTSASLFDAPAKPALTAGADWLGQTVLGSVAVSLCVIAVAIAGLMLMAGRLAIRDAVRIVLGCFVLLGAQTIATGLRAAAGEAIQEGPPQMPDLAESPAPARLPPANYDPYAGASLRIE